MGSDSSKAVNQSSTDYGRWRNAEYQTEIQRLPSHGVASDSSGARTPVQCQDETQDGSAVSLSSYIVPTSSTATSADSKSNRSKSPSPSKKLGLWNVGNTCYTNSVLQVLYENPIFRKRCENEAGSSDRDGLLHALAQLFLEISGAKKARRTLHVNPNKFIQRLKEKNSIFRSPDHHDAHEFYSYLMNIIGDELLKRKADAESLSPARSMLGSKHRWRSKKSSSTDPQEIPLAPCKHPPSITDASPQPSTWLHELFQGYFVYETRCLSCENITRRREPFLDVPLDIEAEQTGNLYACIRHFARTEVLKGKDKYFCDLCSCLQEAERSLRFERLPRVLAIHLKRFKFDESRGCYSRVASKVEFPITLSFPCDTLSRDHPCYSPSRTVTLEAIPSSDDNEESNGEQSVSKHVDVPQVQNSKQQTGPEFDLFGVVVHIGTTMSHGHYVSCVKGDDHSWWLYDDHNVKPLEPASLSSFYGSGDKSVGVKCGYLLFYTSKIPVQFEYSRPSDSRLTQLFQSFNFSRRKSTRLETEDCNSNWIVVKSPAPDRAANQTSY